MVVLVLLIMYIYANIYMLLEDGLRMGNMRKGYFVIWGMGISYMALTQDNQVNINIDRKDRVIIPLRLRIGWFFFFTLCLYSHSRGKFLFFSCKSFFDLFLVYVITKRKNIGCNLWIQCLSITNNWYAQTRIDNKKLHSEK